MITITSCCSTDSDRPHRCCCQLPNNVENIDRMRDIVLPDGVVVRELDLRLKRSLVRLTASRFQITTLGKLFTDMCLCHQAVYFGTGQGAVMPCGWEGNRRSGVTLAMRHRLQWFIHLRAQGLGKGDEHPAYSPRGVRRSLLSRRIFPILYIVFKNAPTKTFRRGSGPPSKLSKAWFPQSYTPQTPCRLVQHSSLL